MEEYIRSQPEQEIKVDVGEFDQNLRKVLFELQRKRILLDECRQKLNESILKQQDFERQLMNEKHKNTNEEYHNIILRKATEALEEERQKNSKELIKLKVELEFAVAERHSLRGQVRSQCLEINNLKRQVDDLSSKHRYHASFQKDISEQLHKNKMSLTEFNDLLNPLRKKLNELENISQINVCEQLLLAAKLFEKHKNIVEKEKDEIERKLIIKSAELLKLQQLLKNSSFITKTIENDKIMDCWKKTCKDLEYQLNCEKDGNEKLTNTLKLSHENEKYLRKKLLKVEEKITELENLHKRDTEKNDTETQTEIIDSEVIEIVDLVKSETTEN